MGIKGLAKLLSDEAPECIKEVPLKSLNGRKIAIDASMAIYQFLIAVRAGGNSNNVAAQLTNADGETTSHIQGIFNRTIRYMTEGIRPVYVFDGKPPTFKSGELTKRKEKRQKAEAELKIAQESGNVEEQTKQTKRLVRAGQKENNDCIKLLQLMGIPVIQAPCEAEAQASSMAKAGVVYAVGTEDMDALTFACPIVLRKMTFATQGKSDIQTMDYAKAIEGLDLTHDQFVDLCILLGCDYCDTIRGVGPKTALKLIREHGCIEKILDVLDRKKYGIPDEWIPEEAAAAKKDAKKKKMEEKKEEEKKECPTDDDDDNDEEGGKTKKKKKDDDDDSGGGEDETNDNDDEEKEEEENNTQLTPVYVEARKLFNEHEVLKGSNLPPLKWTKCQADELTKFLVEEMAFSPERVKSSIDKLNKAVDATSKPQMRMDNFFKVKAAPNAKILAEKKRKAAAAAKKGGGKKAKAGGGAFFGKKKR